MSWGHRLAASFHSFQRSVYIYQNSDFDDHSCLPTVLESSIIMDHSDTVIALACVLVVCLRSGDTLVVFEISRLRENAA